jgi:hypothetical protein
MNKQLLLIACTAVLLAHCVKNKETFKDGRDEGGYPAPSITVDTNSSVIDVSKYAQARVFPGLVCNTETRLKNLAVTMNLNFNYVKEQLRISTPPEPQFSTGLYAAPGELVTIDVPADYSLSIQVGAWSDNLSTVLNAPRDPLIYTRMQLAPGRNYVRNLYGGHIYIFAARPVATPVTLTFSGAVRSPDFELGKTTNAQWTAAIRASCVPYLELRSKNICFVVPRDYCVTRNIQDPESIMKEWDRAIDLDYYQWEGLAENPTDAVDLAPVLPWRVVQDIKPSLGYGHSGFPVVTYNDFGWFDEFTNLTAIKKGWAWGTFHEIGHNNQQGDYWSWASLGETSNNLFSFKVSHRQSIEKNDPAAWPPYHPAVNSMFPQALAFAAATGTKNFDGTDARINDPFARITPFVQVFDKIPANWGYPGQPDGWAFMTELYKRARREVRPSNNDQDKRDFVYETLCDFTKTDWRLFFAAWGINISTVSLNTIDAKDYRLLSQEIWKYNPITRTGGDTYANVYNRANWTVTVNSLNAEGGGKDAVKDGNVTTYWHSAYGPTAPVMATIDMGFKLDIKGFRFTQRQGGGRNIKNMKVEISKDNINWTPVDGSPLLLQKIDAQQNFTLPAVVRARYFRLTISSPADTYNPDGTLNTSLAEVDVIQP